MEIQLDYLADLIALLKQNGVSKFECGGLCLEFGVNSSNNSNGPSKAITLDSLDTGLPQREIPPPDPNRINLPKHLEGLFEIR